MADHIIALDDTSTDTSRKILENAGVTVISWPSTDTKVNMSARRNFLLQKGREAGGTHFIWLDADETFSANFVSNGRKKILSLTPGQKIKMRWIFLWKSNTEYITGNSDYAGLTKDFIVCNSPELSFENKVLSEGRTPGTDTSSITLPEEEGVVIHFQFAAWEANQLKQAWYRCIELVNRPNEARAINNMYAITRDSKNILLSQLPIEWLSHIPLPDPTKKSLWQDTAIRDLFAERGILFFEPLDIWHIPALREMFIVEIGREPRPLVDSRLKKIAKRIKRLFY